MMATHAAGGLRPREIWVVARGMENAGLYMNDPTDPEVPPSKIGGGLDDTAQMLTVIPSGSPSGNAAALQAIVDAAAGLEPNGAALSASNWATVLVFPGSFDFESDGLVLEHPFVRVVGVGLDPLAVQIKTGNSSGGGAVQQESDHVGLFNLSLAATSASGFCYRPESDLPHTILDNIVMIAANADASATFSNSGHIYSGTYRRVVSSGRLFGSAGDESELYGRFIECEGGAFSFIHAGGSDAVGRFDRCVAGPMSFQRVTGRLEDCRVPEVTLNDVGAIESALPDFRGKIIGGEFYAPIDPEFPDKTAILLDEGASVYGAHVVGRGTGKSIDAGSAVTAAIAHCRLNKGIGSNVTNTIGTPYNVDDADLS